MNDLVFDIQNAIDAAGGTWGIVLEDLDLHETWSLNEDELFYAASVIKIPVMVSVFSLFEQGELTLSDTVTLKREDLVGGSGVLQHMTIGGEITVYDLVTLMIIQSDNTATNMLIELVGVENVQKTMKAIAMEKSTFYNKLMTVPANRKGNNKITASDMAKLLKGIATGTVVSRNACEQMIKILKKQQIRDCLPANLPDQESDIVGANPEWELANKTGWVPGIRHDVGIFYIAQRQMIVTFFSQGVDDLNSKQVLAEIGQSIYNYLKR